MGSVRHEFLIRINQSGTATSSPADKTASQSNMNIANVIIWMRKQAYEDSTTRKVAKILRHLKRNCNTADPEEVKLYIANKQCSNGRKQNLIEAYAIYLMSIGIEWKDKPFYKRYDKKHRAPKEELLDFMINHFRLEMALKLSMLKDLGARPMELTRLTVQDIDLNTGNVSITGAKHTIGREGKLKTKTLTLLKIYIEKKKLTANSKLFPIKPENFANDYRHYRNRLAKDYNMPELKQICLYDFRRFKASKEYKLSRHNLLYVKQLLGHKDIKTTEKYITLFDERNITWIPVVCTTQEEIEQAIQDDCEFICQADGKTYFKKPA
ncbi:MAG: site-specific integrase [Candidatus Bathyarchaeia archaeon]